MHICTVLGLGSVKRRSQLLEQATALCSPTNVSDVGDPGLTDAFCSRAHLRHKVHPGYLGRIRVPCQQKRTAARSFRPWTSSDSPSETSTSRLFDSSGTWGLSFPSLMLAEWLRSNGSILSGPSRESCKNGSETCIGRSVYCWRWIGIITGHSPTREIVDHLTL
jgi:hypothetical protein